MGGDENRIEIIIDAAETKSAAKSATEANQRLSEFRKALDAFKNGVGDLNKTIETNTTTVANFNTFLKDFSVKLNDNLSKMQESVIKDFEPRLEKNLENMVARAINKVEAKTSAPGKESRSRSEPKAGAGAPVNNVATVAQPKGYESPDAIMRETIDSVRKRIIDPLTGAVQEATTQKTKTTTTRVERFQEERDDGEIVNVERKINDVVHSVSKIGSITDALNKTKFTDNPVEQYLEDINKKWKSTDPDLPDFAGSISDAIEKSTASHTWASPMDQFSKTMQKPIENIYGSGTGYGKPVKEKGEKKSNNWADPSNMLRREITGALIALHVIKVVAGNSQVAASGFNMISNAIGHLLNVALLPMIPIFSMFAQLIHQVANVINSMPYGIRLLIGGLVMWKATSTLIASMPIREFGSGIEQLKENLKGGSDTLNKFGEVVKALINFMNSGLRSGRVQGLAEWVGGKIRGKRAAGGPVRDGEPYLVGEKGPEIYVPTRHGTDDEKAMLRRHADMLSSQFPSAAKNLDQIAFTAGGYRTHQSGIYTPYPDVIALNRDQYGLSPEDENWERKKREFAARNGIHPPGTEHKSATLWHEFGHHIEEMIRRGVYGDEIKREFDELHRSNLDRATVSEYATSPGTGEYDEGFAEAFAAHYFSPDELSEKSPYLRKVSEILDKIKFRARGGPVLGQGAYIVGEKGPEIFVPKTSGSIIPNHKIGRAEGGDVEAGGGLPFGDLLGGIGVGIGVGGLTALLTGSVGLGSLVGAGVAIGPAAIAQSMSTIISSDIGQQVVGSLNVLTGTISSLFAPLAPIFGILSVALGVVTGLKGGGGGGDRGAETTAKVGNAINSTVSRGNFGIQSVINTGNMGTNKMLSMILVRLAGCLRVAPCDGANFGGAETTVIAGLLPAILASIIAIPQGINTKLGEFITEATVKIKSIWEPIPQPEALQDRVAKIRYQIETVGAVPIAENVSARIQYTIVTTGTIPEVTNRVATLEYVETVRPLTEEQVRAAIERVSNIAERYPIEIETSLKAIEPADIALLTERIETLAAVDPVEIKVKILADGTPEFTFKEVPRVISIADIRTADVSKLSPVRAPTTLYVPEGTVPLLPAGISAKLPVVYDTSRSVLPSIKDPIKLPMNPEISGFVGDGKGGYKASGRFNGGFVDMSGAKIPGWEYIGNGMYKKIGAFEGPIEFKVAEGFKLSDLFSLEKLKEAGKGFGGIVGFGILDGLKEFMTTGKINWGDFFTRNVVYLVAGGVIKMFAGAIVAEVVGAISLGVLAHEVKGLFDPIIQRALDGVDGTGFLGNLFHRLFMPENSQGVTNILGPVMGGLLVSTVETGLEILSNTPLGQKLVTAMQSAFANAGDLGNILSMGQNLAIILNPGTDLITKMEAFNNLFKKTVDGGIPVDVKMDVESMTQTIKSVASTINSDGTYTYKPTGSTQPIGTNPVSPDGTPIQGPLKPDGSFALGGPVAAGGLYLVGEKGPELFAPDVGGQIIPNNKIGGGGGSNVTINQTYNVTTNNPKELTDTVMRELKMELARVKM